ncbi:MAG: type II toxin-antitoxin system PemK/MazF family toxin [Candidatus Gastranaerophilales bacterium]|nr:type II toxin-antitoxin system PemK/MazF family toxin [Candidatus Gastranaerophilales bacterium]
MIYSQFDIILVPFPFTDKDKSKKRPAIVLNNPNYQMRTNHLILAMITSAKNSNWDSDFDIKEIDSTGLKTSCVIRYKLFSLDERIILKKIGSISQNEQKQVKDNLLKHF